MSNNCVGLHSIEADSTMSENTIHVEVIPEMCADQVELAPEVPINLNLKDWKIATIIAASLTMVAYIVSLVWLALELSVQRYVETNTL